MNKVFNKVFFDIPIEIVRSFPKEDSAKLINILLRWLDKKYKLSHENGVIEGLAMYAHWKDGVQYVGTSGTTLEEAIKKVKNR